MIYILKVYVYLINFCVSKSFYSITEDALLQKTFTNILYYCGNHSAYIIFHMTNLINVRLQFLKKDSFTGFFSQILLSVIGHLFARWPLDYFF